MSQFTWRLAYLDSTLSQLKDAIFGDKLLRDGQFMNGQNSVDISARLAQFPSLALPRYPQSSFLLRRFIQQVIGFSA